MSTCNAPRGRCDRDVWELPPLDVDAATAGAAEFVARELADCHDAEARARRAAEVLTEALAAVEAARATLRAAAWWLTQDYHVRRGANIPAAMGLNRVRWKVLRDRMRANPPARVPDALTVLPEQAATVAMLNAVIKQVTEARYEAIVELDAQEWTRAAIGRLIGRDPSRVSALLSERATKHAA